MSTTRVYLVHLEYENDLKYEEDIKYGDNLKSEGNWKYQDYPYFEGNQ